MDDSRSVIGGLRPDKNRVSQTNFQRTIFLPQKTHAKRALIVKISNSEIVFLNYGIFNIKKTFFYRILLNKKIKTKCKLGGTVWYPPEYWFAYCYLNSFRDFRPCINQDSHRYWLCVHLYRSALDHPTMQMFGLCRLSAPLRLHLLPE